MAAAPKLVPRHVAIIMDGNGRWAKNRGLPRIKGHEKGADAVRECVEGCGELKIEFLTLYAFSAENWQRPKTEVFALMRLLEKFLKEKTPELLEKNVRLQAIGRLTDLPAGCQKQLHDSIERTSGNNGLTLIHARSFGPISPAKISSKPSKISGNETAATARFETLERLPQERRRWVRSLEEDTASSGSSEITRRGTFMFTTAKAGSSAGLIFKRCT